MVEFIPPGNLTVRRQPLNIYRVILQLYKLSKRDGFQHDSLNHVETDFDEVLVTYVGISAL